MISDYEGFHAKGDIPGSSSSHSQIKNVQGIQGVKLPPINLQKFNGDYKDWLEFRDLFESLINANGSIPNIQKFHYLRASLQGGAAQVIRSIELSGESYPLAWDTLCKRYENKKILIQNHIQALFNLSVLTSECSGSLRNMIDTVSKHLASLKVLNQPCDSWDTLLIYIMGCKLDKTTFREWEEKKANLGEYLPSFPDFMVFLKARADFLEHIELIKNKEINVQKIISQVGKTVFLVYKILGKILMKTHLECKNV